MKKLDTHLLVKNHINNWWKTYSKDLKLSNTSFFYKKAFFTKYSFLLFSIIFFLNLGSLFLFVYMVGYHELSKFFIYLPFLLALPICFILVWLLKKYAFFKEQVINQMVVLKQPLEVLNNLQVKLLIYNNLAINNGYKVLDIYELSKQKIKNFNFHYDRLNVDYIYNSAILLEKNQKEIKIGSIFRIQSIKKNKASFLKTKYIKGYEEIIEHPSHNIVSKHLLIESDIKTSIKSLTIVKKNKFFKKKFLNYYTLEDWINFKKIYSFINGKRDNIKIRNNKIYLELMIKQKIMKSFDRYNMDKNLISILTYSDSIMFFSEPNQIVYNLLKPPILYKINAFKIIDKKKLCQFYYENVNKDNSLIKNIIHLLEIF